MPDELQLWHGNGEHGQVHGHQENEEYEIDIDESRVLPRPPRPDGLGADDVKTQHDAEHEQYGSGCNTSDGLTIAELESYTHTFRSHKVQGFFF